MRGSVRLWHRTTFYALPTWGTGTWLIGRSRSREGKPFIYEIRLEIWTYSKRQRWMPDECHVCENMISSSNNCETNMCMVRDAAACCPTSTLQGCSPLQERLVTFIGLEISFRIIVQFSCSMIRSDISDSSQWKTLRTLAFPTAA